MAGRKRRPNSSSHLKGGFGNVSKQCIQEIMYTVYASRDVGTLQSLCLVSRAVSQMAEELIYDQLEVVSTDNLGRLINISKRQKTLIKSLKITDHTPTIHTNPTLIWDFISSLPNLEDLDIQYTVLPFSPPRTFRLPNLRAFSFRIISPPPSLNIKERLEIIKQQQSARIDGPTRPSLPYKKLPQEHPDFISQIAISMPALRTLSVLLIGPYEGIQKSLALQMDGIKLEYLHAMEVILAEALLENVPEVVGAFVGYDGKRTRLKNLTVITKHQKMTCSLMVPDPRRDDPMAGYLEKIDIPSLEHIYIFVDRILCPDKCKLPADQREDPCHLPTVPQLHRQLHNWCNKITNICGFELRVRLYNHNDGNHHSDGETPTGKEHEVIWCYRGDWEFLPRDDGKTLGRTLKIAWKRKDKHWPGTSPLGHSMSSLYQCQRHMYEGEVWEEGTYQNQEPLQDVMFDDTQIGRLVGQARTMESFHTIKGNIRSYIEPPGAIGTFTHDDDEVPLEHFSSHAREVMRDAGVRFKGHDIIQGDEEELEEINEGSSQLEEEVDDDEPGDDRYFGFSDQGSGGSGRSEESEESQIGIKRG